MKRRRVGQDEAELVSQLEATHKLVDAATTGGLYAPLPPNMSTDLGAPPPHSSYAAVCELVQSVMAKGNDTGKLWNEKVKEKMVTLDNKKERRSVAARIERKQEKRRKKQEQKLVKSKEIREKKMFTVPEDARKYELYIPLHAMWKEYITENVGTATGQVLTAKLLKADMHGCNIKVTRSKCPSLVGVEGIILFETEQTFQVITPQDQLRVIPKSNNVFTFLVGRQAVTLYGNNFTYRAGERASRKFKNRPSIEL